MGAALSSLARPAAPQRNGQLLHSPNALVKSIVNFDDDEAILKASLTMVYGGEREGKRRKF